VLTAYVYRLRMVKNGTEKSSSCLQNLRIVGKYVGGVSVPNKLGVFHMKTQLFYNNYD
jgi:hypothetical protein